MHPFLLGAGQSAGAIGKRLIARLHLLHVTSLPVVSDLDTVTDGNPHLSQAK
jgi:hypothetical protein